VPEGLVSPSTAAATPKAPKAQGLDSVKVRRPRRARSDGKDGEAVALKVVAQQSERAHDLKRELLQQGKKEVYAAYAHVLDQVLFASAATHQQRSPEKAQAQVSPIEKAQAQMSPYKAKQYNHRSLPDLAMAPAAAGGRRAAAMAILSSGHASAGHLPPNGGGDGRSAAGQHTKGGPRGALGILARAGASQVLRDGHGL